MHALFYIPELVLELVKHADTKRDVLHFGSTCRTIWLVVEEELWGHKGDQGMLLCLVPKSVRVRLRERSLPAGSSRSPLEDVQRSGSSVEIGTSSSAENLTTQAKASVKRHSRSHIRHLILLDEACENEYSSPTCLFTCGDFSRLLKTIAHLELGPSFEPVRSLTLSVCRRSAKYCAPLFGCVSKQISSLDVQIIRPEIWPVDTLESFIFLVSGALQSANIHKFVIGTHRAQNYAGPLTVPWDVPDRSRPDAIETAFTRACRTPVDFKSLSTVNLNCIADGSQVFAILGQLPALKHLTLKFHSLDPFPQVDLNVGFPTLESGRFLTHWALSRPSPRYQPSYPKFLNSVSSPNLSLLYFSISMDTELLESLMLIAQKWPTTLKDLRIIVDDTDPHDILPPLSLLADLTCLQNLTVLCKDVVMLTDEDIARIVAAVPNLHSFYLTTLRRPERGEEPLRPAATLLSLVQIAGGLPELRHLKIAVDFENALKEDTLVIPDPKVESIDLDLSYYGKANRNHPRITQFLAKVFPSLSESEGGPNKHLERLREIGEIQNVRLPGMPDLFGQLIINMNVVLSDGGNLFANQWSASDYDSDEDMPALVDMSDSSGSDEDEG